MKLMNLLEDLKFGNKDPRAEPLHADSQDRVILFTLKPNQSMREHQAPSSPFFVVILKGKGIFAGSEGVELTCGPSTLLAFDAGEPHTIRAVDELVFVGFLHGMSLAQNYKRNEHSQLIGQEQH